MEERLAWRLQRQGGLNAQRPLTFLRRSGPGRARRPGFGGGPRKNARRTRPDYQEDDTLDVDAAWQALEVNSYSNLKCCQEASPTHASPVWGRLGRDALGVCWPRDGSRS